MNNINNILNQTYKKIDDNKSNIDEFKNYMESIYFNSLNEIPTFTEEMIENIKNEFNKMYEEAEKYFKKQNQKD